MVCGTGGELNSFATALLYINKHLSQNSSNRSPKRECGLERVTFSFSIVVERLKICVYIYTTPTRGGGPGQFSLLCRCGVENTPRWVGTSGLHGTQRQALGATWNFVHNDAVLSMGEGGLESTLF